MLAVSCNYSSVSSTIEGTAKALTLSVFMFIGDASIAAHRLGGRVTSCCGYFMPVLFVVVDVFVSSSLVGCPFFGKVSQASGKRTLL